MSGIDFNLSETSGNLDNLFVINKDSDVDIAHNIFVNYIFCSHGEETDQCEFSDDEIEDRIFGDADEEDEPIQPICKNKKRTKKGDSVPQGFDIASWKKGTHPPLEPLPAFKENAPGGNFDAPSDANELFFFNLFISDAVIQDMTYQTNLYAEQFF